MKTIRRMSALVLAVAIIAMLGISASAASYTYSRPYTGNRNASCAANLSTLSAHCNILLICAETPDNYLSTEIRAVFQETALSAGTLTTRSYVNVEEHTTETYNAISYNSSTVSKITEAKFYFYASFDPYAGGPFVFSPDPVILYNA